MAKYEGLDYMWIAQMTDGKEVAQFDENGENEVLFKTIKENRNVETFWLMNTKNKKREFAVNLKNGTFLAFGKWIAVAQGDTILSSQELLKYRLIYFRQVTHLLGTVKLETQATTIVFVIGWQANDPITGQNIKKMLQVHNADTIAIG